MNILYVSTLCSDKLIKDLFDAGYKPIQAIQKFNKLLVKGLVENGCDVYALTEIPKTVGPKFFKRNRETESGVKFIYSRKVNIKLIYNLYVFLAGFFLTLRWGLSNKKKDSVAILDVLQTEFSSGSLLACKLLKIVTTAIVTDLPGLPGLLASGKKTAIHRLIQRMIDRYANSFDSYILLTEQMNEVVNIKGRPYMIMEGLVDANMAESNSTCNSNGKKVVIYAGGLYEEYGIKYLVDGFKLLDDDNAELHLYGHGPMVSYIEKEMVRDNRIHFFGIVHNSKVVEAELQATLLVNPRPSAEDFTKYSFPSKNMEYMVSGTPVLTTVLPGMPREYHEYVYLLEDETAEGLGRTLTKLLTDTPAEELRKKGESAKKFVLENKNNIYQSKRVIDFIGNNK